MTDGPIFSPDPSLYPDPSGRAERMCQFVRRLKLWEGEFAGQPFTLHPFQEAAIRRIYGPVTEDGSPLVRTAALWLPRGNAKTTLAAGLSLAHFMGPMAEAGGQVIFAGGDREQAGIAFNHSWNMVQQDDALRRRVQPIPSRKRLIHPKTRSSLNAISSESYSKHGMAASFFLADEVHAWQPAEARQLFGVIRDSMVKREHPLTIIISTAGSGTGGLAWDLWDYSHKVASGEIDDPSFAPIIFAAPSDADWLDEDAWKQANPAIEGGFCSLEELRIKARRVQHFPAEIADFRRFHLNQWTEGAAEPWLALELYDTAEDRQPEEALTGRPCWLGVDLSSVEDLTAVVAVFPVEDDSEGRRYDVLAQFFLPEAGIDRKAEQDRADYLRWSEEGFLTLTPGNVVDHSAIVEHVASLGERFSVQEVAIDRWNSTAVNTALQEEGFEVAQFGQGFASMAGPVKELKRAILSGHFRHGGNPVLRMCFSNAVAEKDAAENEKLTKSKARGRIDGAIASAMAIGRVLSNETLPSPYETARPEGFVFL
ncbi:terminase large subunit [Fodinicurvata fenggangensis]|uniref:terminase large subunit n=1 Tax=Fodinicurvata fenggangensis TaxID=1121830 RepID=UPI00047E9BEC|nr:terminase TerL endonuclease subunit [Fodinicurvata fenggangensis]